MDFLSFIPCGIPASSRLVYRPVYPQSVIPIGIDIHDGGERIRRDADEEFRRRDEEILDARNRLREQLRDAVFGVTRKPPPLDASPKELASIARKSGAFDYRGALAELSRLEADAARLARDREERKQAFESDLREQMAKRVKARLRQEEEALLLLLLH